MVVQKNILFFPLVIWDGSWKNEGITAAGNVLGRDSVHEESSWCIVSLQADTDVHVCICILSQEK